MNVLSFFIHDEYLSAFIGINILKCGDDISNGNRSCYLKNYFLCDGSHFSMLRALFNRYQRFWEKKRKLNDKHFINHDQHSFVLLRLLAINPLNHLLRSETSGLPTNQTITLRSPFKCMLYTCVRTFGLYNFHNCCSFIFWRCLREVLVFLSVMIITSI